MLYTGPLAGNIILYHLFVMMACLILLFQKCLGHIAAMNVSKRHEPAKSRYQYTHSPGEKYLRQNGQSAICPSNAVYSGTYSFATG